VKAGSTAVCPPTSSAPGWSALLTAMSSAMVCGLLPEFLIEVLIERAVGRFRLIGLNAGGTAVRVRFY